LLSLSGEVKIFGKNPFLENEILEKLNYLPSEASEILQLKVKDILLTYTYLYNLKNPEKRK